MAEIKVIKLISGEEFLATVVRHSKENKELVIKDPLYFHLEPVQDGGEIKIRVSAEPFSRLTEEKMEITVDSSHVFVIMEPRKEVAEYYTQFWKPQSDLILPKEKGLVVPT